MAEQSNRGLGGLRFVDWFAGIGGFRLGLERAGHSCVWSCEINPFSRSVYAARFGAPPEAEDVTRVRADEIPQADLWTAGFPCQDVSTAGLRGGLGASRSGLVWTLLDLAAEARPKWILLENVPGLLQFRDGFGELLARLEDLGYVGAWRVLDAQFFGVPQRRRRVFILAGRSGECRPDEVLLEPEGVCGRSSPRRKARSGSAEGAHGGAGGGVAKPLLAHAGKRDDYDTEDLIAATVQASAGHHGRSSPRGDGSDNLVAATLHAHGRSVRDDFNCFAFSITPEGGQGADIRATEVDLAPAINATSEARSNDRGLRVIGFDMAQVTAPENRSRCEPGEPAPTLAKESRPSVAFCVPLDMSKVRESTETGAGTPSTGVGRDGDPAYTLSAQGAVQGVAAAGVRRLTPRECERLQGFPDDWTLLDGGSDSQRYKAIGNSVAVPVIRWIGERLR